MISFSNPIMLWSLLGLSIPIAIHFLSRKEGRVIMIGSVRHLEESPSQQFKGIKLNEYWLLLLRALLITILSFFLAGAQYVPESGNSKKWLIIEKALLEKSMVQKLIDSLSLDGYEIHLLAPDFPLTESNKGTTQSDYYTLLEELKDHNLDKGIVITGNHASFFNGDVMSLPENIQWLSIPSDPVHYLLSSQDVNKDSLSLRYGYSDSDLTYFRTELIHKNNYKDSVAITGADTLTIHIYADNYFQYDKSIIEAALSVIQKTFKVNIIKEDFTSKSDQLRADWLIWFSNEPVPPLDGKILYFQAYEYGRLIQKVSFNQWALTQRLNQELSTQQHLTLQIASLLINTEALEKRVLEHDASYLSDSLAFAPSRNESVATVSPMAYQPLNSILFILFFSLFIIERSLSYIRKQ
jgi:Aerotolerance regulator N-terminal